MNLKHALLNMLFPDRLKCIACGDELNTDFLNCLCKQCHKDIENHKNATFCNRCGRYLKAAKSYCPECQSKTPQIFMARAPFVFDGKIKSLVYALKYGNSKYLAPYLASYMVKAFLKENIIVDFVTFVPISKVKQKLRGYNQAHLLADNVAKLLNLPCINVLDKTNDAKNAARLNRYQRKEYLKNSFKVLPGINFNNKTALIVDDVFTTGTTVNECAKMLINCNVKQVNVLTFATSKAILRTKSIRLTCKPKLIK